MRQAAARSFIVPLGKIRIYIWQATVDYHQCCQRGFLFHLDSLISATQLEHVKRMPLVARLVCHVKTWPKTQPTIHLVDRRAEHLALVLPLFLELLVGCFGL